VVHTDCFFDIGKLKGNAITFTADVDDVTKTFVKQRRSAKSN
jgi:hypothetical protein